MLRVRSSEHTSGWGAARRQLLHGSWGVQTTATYIGNANWGRGLGHGAGVWWTAGVYGGCEMSGG